MTFHSFRVTDSWDEAPGSSYIDGALLEDLSIGEEETLVAWYRASYGVVESGGKVTQWQDASGNGHHLVQGTVASQPVYSASGNNRGYPALDFTNAVMSHTSPMWLQSNFYRRATIYLSYSVPGNVRVGQMTAYAIGDVCSGIFENDGDPRATAQSNTGSDTQSFNNLFDWNNAANGAIYGMNIQLSTLAGSQVNATHFWCTWTSAGFAQQLVWTNASGVLNTPSSLQIGPNSSQPFYVYEVVITAGATNPDVQGYLRNKYN